MANISFTLIGTEIILLKKTSYTGIYKEQIFRFNLFGFQNFKYSSNLFSFRLTDSRMSYLEFLFIKIINLK